MAQWFDITAPPNATLQSTMAAWGLQYDPNDPYAALYQKAIASARPYGGKKPYQPGGNWDIFCEMCLRARDLFFAETKIGDCGFTGSSAGGFGLTQGVGLTEGGLGGLSAISSVTGIASGLASAIPIVGSIIGLAANIFSAFSQHHQQAVKIEKGTLCQATQQIGAYISTFYQAVEQGAATPAQGVAAMQQAAQAFHNSWTQAGVKVISCNDACGMDAIMAAHIAFIGMLGTQPQSGSLVGSDIASPAGAAGSNSLAAAAAVPTIAGFSDTWIIVGLVVLVVIWMVL